MQIEPCNSQSLVVILGWLHSNSLSNEYIKQILIYTLLNNPNFEDHFHKSLSFNMSIHNILFIPIVVLFFVLTLSE